MSAAARPLQGASGRRTRHSRRPLPPPLDAHHALFLDIDGTLLEIAATPDGARVDTELAVLLPALRHALGGAVALITGRTLADVDRLFPKLAMPVAALHGSERRAADGTLHRHPPSDLGLAVLRRDLGDFAARHPGLIFEDKGTTFALHYRAAPALASLVHRTVKRLVVENACVGLEPQRGKGILELRPEGRDKGTAIDEYLSEPPFAGRTPVFLGDDVTDEFGFAVVSARGGVAVKVGPGSTRAPYRLPDVSAVRRWLVDSLAPAKGSR